MLSNENHFRYDAFISYRHCDPDKRIAEKLHRMLETYKIPKAIVKASGKKRINRVFRDREELPTSSNLADCLYKPAFRLKLLLLYPVFLDIPSNPLSSFHQSETMMQQEPLLLSL